MNKENVSQMAAFDNPLACNDEKEPINPSENTPEDSESDEKYDMWDEEHAAPPRGRVLFIDADACPVTSVALACARDACTPVVIVGNTTQNLERHIRHGDPRSPEKARGRDASHDGFWVDVLDVSIGADSADFAIVERLLPNDIVVTQDIGLASMVLGRGAAAIGVRGRVYDKATIDMQLFIRHEEKRYVAPEDARAGQSHLKAQTERAFATTLSSCSANSWHPRSQGGVNPGPELNTA